MEIAGPLLILFLFLLLDVLALRYGVDSRDLTRGDWTRPL